MQPIPSVSRSRAVFALAVVIVALSFFTTALINRLPILFPDTIGYSSAGEAVLGAIGSHGHHARHRAVHAGAATPSDNGISEARSPYYGVALALVDRVGGVWLAAIVQALIAATALLLALRRLRLTGRGGVATVTIVFLAGLAFYACVLIPDVFLGPAILALAFLPTDAAMSRGERLFWALTLVASLLFHRGFLAVGLVVLAGTAVAWRASWFARRGWLAAAAACVVALVAHAAVAPVVSAVYGAKMASQPFLLARMIEGRVVPAYLADVCPTKPYYLCRLRGRLPMDHDKFLWDGPPDGVFNTMTLAEKTQLNAEANAIVVGAVVARPLAALGEAIDYSVREFFFAGMNDFAQRVPTRWHIDAPLVPAMVAYPASGIVAGDFPLHDVSRVTQTVYGAALVVLVAAGFVLARPAWIGRRRTVPVDLRLVATIAIIVAGIAVNAAVSGTLSGIRDRYTGRIAWLASVAAAATLCHALATTRARRGDERA